MAKATLPDGRVIRFPDGLPPDRVKMIIEKAKQNARPDNPSAAFEALPTWQKPLVAADDIVRQMADGITFGYADKMAAKANEFFGSGDYDANLAQERQLTQDAGERAGSAGIAANIAGSLIPASRAMKYGVTAASIPRLPGMAAAAVDGTALGALSAAGHDQDIAMGAGIGAIAGPIGEGVGRLATKAVTPAVRDTSATLANRASKAYADLDASGVLYAPSALSGLLNTTRSNLVKMGFHPKNQPGAAVALGELERVVSNGLPVNSTGMQTLKEVIRGGYDNSIKPNAKNNAMITAAIKQIDDMILKPKPGQIFAGDAVRASRAYGEANKAYSQSKKMDRVAAALKEAEERASTTGSGGNVENAMRQELKKLSKDKGWTSDEKAQLRRAYGGTFPRTLTRWAGNASPMGNGLMASLWASGLTGAGIATGGTSVPLMLAGAGLTSGAKIAGQKLTKSAAQKMADIIAVGGRRKDLPQPTPKQKAMIEALTRSLIVGGATVPQN